MVEANGDLWQDAEEGLLRSVSFMLALEAHGGLCSQMVWGYMSTAFSCNETTTVACCRPPSTSYTSCSRALSKRCCHSSPEWPELPQLPGSLTALKDTCYCRSVHTLLGLSAPGSTLAPCHCRRMMGVGGHETGEHLLASLDETPDQQELPGTRAGPGKAVLCGSVSPTLCCSAVPHGASVPAARLRPSSRLALLP